MAVRLSVWQKVQARELRLYVRNVWYGVYLGILQDAEGVDAMCKRIRDLALYGELPMSDAQEMLAWIARERA